MDTARADALDPGQIAATIKRLNRRIEERFPESGLGRQCASLLQISEKATQESQLAAQPIWWLRGCVFTLIALMLLALLATLASLKQPAAPLNLAQFVQLLEAGIQDLILIGAAILSLVTYERRIKRDRILKALHQLRAMAHIIDMHQLTKDPERTLSGGQRTPSSPKRDMTVDQLSRYLDYCSELLSLTGKIAALYIQNFDDALVLSTVNEIETLTTGLSNKIWQKMVVLHTS